VRLGTDQARYHPDDRVRVRARLVAPDHTPIAHARPAVAVYAADRLLLRRLLPAVPESPGMYAADIGAFAEGRYRVELEIAAGELAPEAAPATPVSTEFAVVSVSPVELIELAADRGRLARLALLTGGRVTEPTAIGDVPERLGPPAVERSERRQIDLWDNWLLLLLIVIVAGSEWLIRKRVSLH